MSKIDINKTIAELHPGKTNSYWKYFKYANAGMLYYFAIFYFLFLYLNFRIKKL